jgi:gamma-glutamyltranspeptidase
MAPPSSGGSTVGEALNILDNVNLTAMTRTQALHHYFEASALAYADRGAYVADPSAMPCRWTSCSPSGSPTSATARSTPAQR